MPGHWKPSWARSPDPGPDSDPARPSIRPGLGDLPGRVCAMEFSPDNRFLVTGDDEGHVRLWDVARPSAAPTILDGHTGSVCAVAFSPDGGKLATGSRDGTARLWDLADTSRPAAETTLVGHASTVLAVAFSADGRSVITGSSDGTVRTWDVSHTAAPGALASLAEPTSDAAVSPDGHLLATEAGSAVTLWDIAQADRPAPIATLRGHRGVVIALAFSPDGHTLASGSHDGTVMLWDVSRSTAPAPLSTVEPAAGSIWSVAFNPRGDTLAIAVDSGVRIFDVSDPRHSRYVGSAQAHLNVGTVRFGGDGRILAAIGGDASVWLVDVTDMQAPRVVATFPDRDSRVASATLDDDGQLLVFGDNDGRVRILNIADPAHWKAVASLDSQSGVSATSLAFSANGTTLAVGGDDGTVRVLDLRDRSLPQPLVTFPGNNRVRRVEFDYRDRIVVVSEHSSPVLWDTSATELIPRVCAQVSGPIWEGDWGYYLPGLPYNPPCSP